MQTKRFQNCFPTHLAVDFKQGGKSAVGQLDATLAIQHQQTFDHAVEQRFLLGLKLEHLPSPGRVGLIDLSAGLLLGA
jgi:hypothetical protein